MRFAIASFNSRQALMARQLISESGLSDQDIAIHIDRTPELIEAASVCLACSGSVSLELLYHTKPSVIQYQTSQLAYRVQDRFRIARYITLVNLLETDRIERNPGEQYDPDAAGAESLPMPEYLAFEDRSADIANRLKRLVSDEAHYGAVKDRLAKLCEQYAVPGASEHAADYIVDVLNCGEATSDSESTIPRPHFLRKREVGKIRLRPRSSD